MAKTKTSAADAGRVGRGNGQQSRTVAVIGGGVSGLAAAYYIRKLAAARNLDVRVLVFEKEKRAGGKVRTHRRGGFVIEAGPDSVMTANSNLMELCAELGLTDRMIGQRAENQGVYIFSRGALEKLPEGSGAMLPTRVMPMLTTGLISFPGKIRASAEILLPKSTVHGEESVAAFVTRRFGREIYERIAEPLCAVIYAVDPEKASLKRTLPYLARMEAEHSSILKASLAMRKRPGNASMPTSVSFEGGMAELVDALAGKVGKRNISLGVEIGSISRPGGRMAGRYLVNPLHGHALAADAVVMAVPAYEVGRITAGMDGQLAATASEIPYSTLAIITLAYDSDRVSERIAGTGFLVPRVEGRKVSAVTVSSNKWPKRAPKGHSLIRCYFNDSYTGLHVSSTDARLVEMAKEELRDIAGIDEEPAFSHVQRWEKGMPIYTVGSGEKVSAIEEMTRTHPGLFVTGAWKRGIGIPSCISESLNSAMQVIEYFGKAK